MTEVSEKGNHVESFTQWLYATPISTMIRDAHWLVPTVQSIHIMAVGIIIGSALVMDLRFAGVLGTDESESSFVARYLPWTWGAVAVLAVTGLVQTIGEPDRVLSNSFFWTKMCLLAVGLVLMLLFRRPLLNPEYQMEHASWAKLAKPLAWLSLAFWIAIIFYGRWIAYEI